jgi:ribosomal-protein-alanine N-acetyltransferase
MSALPRPNGGRFVPLSEARVAEVLRLEEQIYPYPWTGGNFTDSLRSGYSGWTIEAGDGEILAYAVAMLAVDEAHLLNLAVGPLAQRRGHGASLLDWMVRTMREYGARSMLLEVRPSNESAIRLYRRFGFEPIGMRRGYYPAPGGREDAIVMRLPFPSAP